VLGVRERFLQDKVGYFLTGKVRVLSRQEKQILHAAHQIVVAEEPITKQCSELPMAHHCLRTAVG
jgi:hypothetical protein